MFFLWNLHNFFCVKNMNFVKKMIRDFEIW
jgi:hypothetical protein